MEKEEINGLYDRVNALSELKQTAILATVMGQLQYHALNGDENAIRALKDVKRLVKKWE